MNSYITLDGKRYPAIHTQFMPIQNRPMMQRPLLDGTLDIIYGAAYVTGWEGVLSVPTSESDPYGDIADLRSTFNKKTNVSLTDHYGNTHTVAIIGDLEEDSLTPMWDATLNKFKIKIKMVKVS